MNKKAWITSFSLFVAFMVAVPLLCEYVFSREERESDLPEMKIVIPEDAPPLSRDKWTKDCRVRVFDESGRTDYSSPYLSIQGRGHSTSTKPKKPYKLKLDNTVSLLGLPAHDRYVLLANFFDHSLMRNALAFEVARQTSLAGTAPQGRFVRLSVNGEEQGVYYLCEAVRDMVAENALLLEFDTYSVEEDSYVFRTERENMPVSVRNPKVLPAVLFDGVRRVVNDVEADPVSRVDFDTFADYYLVQELCQNAEPNGPRSCFMHMTSDGRLLAGPVWDFDLAFISVNVDGKRDLRPLRFSHLEGMRHLTEDSLYNNRSLWYGRLLQDSAFVSHVRGRWQLLKPRFEALTAYMDSIDNLIREEAVDDQQRWNHQEPARFDSCTTYESAFVTLRRTYTERIQKLDSLMNRL